MMADRGSLQVLRGLGLVSSPILLSLLPQSFKRESAFQLAMHSQGLGRQMPLQDITASFEALLMPDRAMIRSHRDIRQVL